MCEGIFEGGSRYNARMPNHTYQNASLLLCLVALCGCTDLGQKESEYNRGVQAYRAKDYSAARSHWRESVAQEHQIAAKNNLGYLLFYGLGGMPDIAQGVTLWAQAAKDGNRESQWHLGQATEDGKGTEKSLIEAYAWYRCAATDFRETSAIDELDVEIERDASHSLTLLLSKLSPAEFEAAERLAKAYIAEYSRPAAAK